jgi:hypothetical protein
MCRGQFYLLPDTALSVTIFHVDIITWRLFENLKLVLLGKNQYIPGRLFMYYLDMVSVYTQDAA